MYPSKVRGRMRKQYKATKQEQSLQSFAGASATSAKQQNVAGHFPSPKEKQRKAAKPHKNPNKSTHSHTDNSEERESATGEPKCTHQQRLSRLREKIHLPRRGNKAHSVGCGYLSRAD